MTLEQLGALFLIAWLPGAVAYRLPFLDRERRAALDPEERTFWTILLSIAISLTVLLVLAAAGRYALKHLLIVNAVASVGAVLIWRSRLLLRPPRRWSISAAVPAALAALCWIHFTPPAEYIMAGKDPGTYMNEGIQIAQSGSLFIREPLVASIPPFARELFFPRHLTSDGQPRRDYYGIRFMGFPLKDVETGTTTGQFPHLFPASIAIAYEVGGLTGARTVTPVWAVLGVLAVYFAARRLFGGFAALAAGLLLSVNVIEVWFGKYPNAEVLMQTLLFAVLLASARAHVDGDRYFAPVAGALLGLLLFLRFDAVLAVAGVATGLILGMFAGQRPRLSFILAFGAFVVPAVFYYLGPMRSYADLPIVFISAMPRWQFAALGALVVGALIGLVGASRNEAIRSAFIRSLPVIISLMLCVLGLYALYLRHPAGRLAEHDAYALRTYANYYVTVPAVLAALIGYSLQARRRFWIDPGLFATVAIFAIFVFFKIRIVPEHFWAARRFVPVILPATMVFAAAAALGVHGSGLRLRFIRPLLGTILLFLLASAYARASRPVAAHTEYEGLIPRVEQLASRIGDADLVIVESRDAQSDVHVIAAPLAYIYGRNVLALQSARPDKPTLAAFIDWARTKYARVLFIGGGGTDLLSHRYAVSVIASDRFQVPEYQSVMNAYPRGPRQKEFEFGVYEFTPPVALPPSQWFDLDVGVNDDLHVLRFNAKEQTEGRTFRWTRGTSYVSVTTFPAASRQLTLVLADGGRPPAAPPARVDVYLHNQQIGTIDVVGRFAPYTLRIPADLAQRAQAAQDPVELRLVSTTWNPSQVLGSSDDRTLGVMVDRVTIK